MHVRRSAAARDKRGRFKRVSHRKYPGPRPRMQGHCRWCGLEIRDPDGKPNRRKTFCGPICVTHFLLRSDPQKMRLHVFFRDDGVCYICGFKHYHLKGPWQADHVKPLFIAYGDPSFWEETNVKIICNRPCHIEKSAADRRKYKKKRPQRVA